MSEATDLTQISATSVTGSEDALKAAINGIGTIVELRPATLAVAASGLQVQKLIDAITTDLDVASTLIIDSPEMLTEAEAIAGRLATVCADSGGIEAERKALTAPFNDLVKRINEGYNAPRASINSALTALKQKILSYNSEQRRLAAEREKQDADARAEAAKQAADLEAKARNEADELMSLADAAQQGGSEIAAAALQQQAQIKVDESRQAAGAAVTAMFTRSVSAPVATAKGVRGKWKGLVLDKGQLIAHVAKQIAAGDNSLLNLLDVNESNLNKLADMQKQSLNLPGVRPEFIESLSVRKAAIPA